VRRMLRQSLIAAIAGMSIALGLASPARSLTADEAEKVSILLVELSAELGDFAYDEEEADRIFDEDEAMNGRIAAAGFTRDSWRTALDATFRGYLATIPNDRFSERLSVPMERLDSTLTLSDEQKAEIRASMEEKITEIQLLRAEGADHAEAVRPHAAALEAVFGAGDLDEDE